VRFRLPPPFVLLLVTVAAAAALTWVVPPGEYDRRDDAATGRRVVVAGTYHAVSASPVNPFAAAVAVPRGFIDAADVIVVVLICGGAWVVVERLGTLTRAVSQAAWRFRHRGLLLVPIVSICFATMGGLENMQEEIIPLVPVMLLLGRGVGVDAVTVVSMSAGAAIVGSAFSPVNPFQAGIAMKLAQLPTSAGFGLRVVMFVAALTLWIAWSVVYARRTRTASAVTAESMAPAAFTGKDVLILLAALLPMAAYVYGSLAGTWGFLELGGAFLIGGCTAGLIGGLGVAGTSATFLEGMQAMLPAAMLIGVARAISVVLADGKIIDSLLYELALPLSHVPAAVSALLMIPFHNLVHIPVPSVSGQAVLTMPVLIPLADLLGMSRQAPVLAYQTGAGMMEALTPTNGALMAVLMAAKVPFGSWIRFAIVGWVLCTLVGIAGILAVLAGLAG
jgi:uncharacterized ion transporter superfamily protein YfcC